MVALLAGLLAAGLAPAAEAGDPRKAFIEWDPGTLVLVQRGGIYGRMARLPNQEILCVYERASRVYARRSRDQGETWDDERLVASYAFGAAANPEVLVLPAGWILVAYNERPTDGIHPFTIRVVTSMDNGDSWGESLLVYEAGVERGTGCWEPAMIQLPSAEIQLFFANERPYPESAEQEITMLRSLDEGATWSEPERIGFRAGHRDGMPVPLVLMDAGGIAVAIEDNGMSGAFKPAILRTSPDDNWRSGAVDGPSEKRWSALETPLPPGVYGGAPYLRQFHNGLTVLSIQSGEGRARSNTLDFSRMAVYIGDANARGFTNLSFPFPVPEDTNGLWNSLFIKHPDTVTAISHTTMFGVRGLWTIDGKLVQKEFE